MANNDNNLDAWDDLEEKSLLDKYKIHLAGACVVLAGVASTFLFKSNPIGEVYANYIKDDFISASEGAERLIANNGASDPDSIRALTVLYKIYSTESTGMLDHAKAVRFGEMLFKASRNEVLARSVIAQINAAEMPAATSVKYFEYLASRGDGTAQKYLVDYYIELGDKPSLKGAMDILKTLPQNAINKMKQAKIMLDRDSGQYNPRQANTLIEESYRMGSPEGAAYLSLIRLEESKRDVQDGDHLIREFRFLANRAMTGGYVGDKAKEIIAIIELGRFGVPRDPSFAMSYQKVIDASLKDSVEEVTEIDLGETEIDLYDINDS
ncbi:hypothetical protein VCHA53O466_40277 [Vibrio chagasii]|nr:hypothetical protein VCHA53O466_40277 [Vibrio chagasii]